MSWHYLQGQAVASWEDICLDGAPDALLRLIPTQDGYCSPDNETACCHDSRSGTTCKPLTASHGADTSTLSAVGFHAKTSAQLAKAQASPASARGSGQKWPESWVRWCPDSSSWKTRQYSLLEGLELFLGTWPRWGTMRGGECWAHATPEHPTSEIESGSLLPTPVADDTGHRQKKYAQGGTPLSLALGGKAHPAFLDWRVGGPIGWSDATELESLATDKFQQWRRSHLKY